MKHKWFIAAIAALVLGTPLAAPRPARAWGEVGHKVIARIAWDAMTAQTRAKLIALLDAAPADAGLASLRPAGAGKSDGNRMLFETAATWPDLVRAKKTVAERTRNAKYHHGPWHYYDIAFSQDASGKVTERTDIKNDPENALSQLAALSKTLADPGATPGDRAVAVAWIEHLVGDLHTPLHNVARVTPEEPTGDKGGNDFKLEATAAPGEQYPKSLHKYWDDLPDTQFPLTPGENRDDRVARVSQAATAVLPRPLFERLGLTQTGRFEQWNREGAELAITRVYSNAVRGQTPGAAYASEAKNTALVCLAKAGYRLAATLDAALAGAK